MDVDAGYVFFGTPLEREEDLSRKQKKQAADEGKLRLATTSQQEVYDENGRRRFHGAFTGGFSAGYYNTVGSKEGWTPQKFTSSRKNRAERPRQSAYDFMDDDEKEEQDSTKLATSSDFDTFGLTAAEFARNEAEQELKKRPSAIPGLLPDEIIVPVSRSIGVELLRKMGWRHGRAIGPKHIAAASNARKEGRRALLAFASTDKDRHYKDDESAELQQEPDQDNDTGLQDTGIISEATLIYVINPKKDRYGFGFDPFQNAPEFRDRQHAQEGYDKTKGSSNKRNISAKPSLFRPNVGRMGGGFGIGALEELDEEDEDIYAPDIELEMVPSDEESLATRPKAQKQLVSPRTKDRILPGFRPAAISVFKVESFPPPIVPPGFDVVHKFKEPLDSEKLHLHAEPAEVAAPEDNQLRKLIDGLATFVARSGQKLENLYMEKRSSNPMFEFLFEGTGHAYYKRRLWEEHKKTGKEDSLKDNKRLSLDSAQRGQILGETPLRRLNLLASEDHTRLQSALASSFTKSASENEDLSDTLHPFASDPAKQARYEQFLKDKYEGGLRSVQAAGRNAWTESERALETIEFETACQISLKRKNVPAIGDSSSAIVSKNLQSIMNDRFVPQTFQKEVRLAKVELPPTYPKREENQWRPTPLVCKRFNLPDPYSGKPPPLPKPRSRTESFIFLTNTPNDTTLGNQVISGAASVSGIESNPVGVENVDVDSNISEIIEKPVDLYKAIFSDEEDIEGDAEVHETVSGDKAAQAAQAALNRLEAGDFLASIGKELGLKVPPTTLNPKGKSKEHVPHVNAMESSSKLLENVKYRHLPSSLSQVSGKLLVGKEVGGSDGAAQGDSLSSKNVLEMEGQFDADTRTKFEEQKDNANLLGDETHGIVSFRDKRKHALSSEESASSDDSSDDSARRKKRRNQRKKDHRHSRKHKDRSHKHHRSKKRSKHEEHRSRSHHRHEGRKS